MTDSVCVNVQTTSVDLTVKVSIMFRDLHSVLDSRIDNSLSISPCT